MQPFDPDALVAMLEAFYQPPSGAALLRARSERPEYFGGGVIFGSKSDKLRLPDGREFDCIVAAGGPASGRRWQCALIDPNAPGNDDPFALEPGPLEPIDEAVVIFPGGEPTFESLVAGELAPLNGTDAALDASAESVKTFDGADALDGAYNDLVEPAVETHEALRAAFELDSIDGVVAATNGADGTIDTARDDYTEPEPPLVNEPDPGDVPPKDGDGGDDGKPG